MSENFDRSKRAQQLAQEHNLPGRLAWLCADPNEDTERANLQAIMEGGVKTSASEKADAAEIERLRGAYQAARDRRDGLAMVTIKHRLGEMGVNLA